MLLKRLAHWILRKELNAALVALHGEQLYGDMHDPDRRAFWKSLAENINEEAARKWAFERLNAHLKRLITVTPNNERAFWVIQGAVAELQNFLRIHDLMALYLKEETQPAEKPKKEKSISDEFE
jgi:hypothetical protein